MFKVDIANRQLIRLRPLHFGRIGPKEHFEVQDWIEHTPAILGEDLLILGERLPLPGCKRLNMLALDRKGSLIAIVVHRDGLLSVKDIDAIKLASWVSSLVPGDIYSLYAAEKLQSDPSYARTRIESFITTDLEKLNQHQRMILVANQFPAEMVSLVQWLRDSYRLDVKCVCLRLYFDSNKDLFITADTVAVPPEANGYIQSQQRATRHPQWGKGSFEAPYIEQPELVRRLLTGAGATVNSG